LGAGSNVEPLHLRLFLEGLEVPVMSGTVSSSIGSPASGQFEIVPTDASLRIAARTTVHAFFLDQNGTYQLLFMGEVFSLIFAKTGTGGRTMVLNCLDFSSVWDTTYLYSLSLDSNADRSVVVANSSKFYGSPELLNSLVGGSAIERVARIIASGGGPKTPGLPKSGIVGGVLALLEMIGGVPGRTIGLYDWATVQERRVRLLEQIASDSGDTATRILQATTLVQWISDQLGQDGHIVSFREILDRVFQFVYYSVVSLPVGRYRPGSKKIPDIELTAAPSSGSSSDFLLPDMAQAEAELLDILATYRESSWALLGLKPSITSRFRGGNPSSPHAYGAAIDFGLSGSPFVRLTDFRWGMAGSKKSAAPIFSPEELVRQDEGYSLSMWHWARAVVREKPSLKDKESVIRAVEQRARDLGKRDIAHNARKYLTALIDFYTDLGRAVSEYNGLTYITADQVLEWGGRFRSSGDPELTALGIPGDIVHVQLKNFRNRTKPNQSPEAIPEALARPASEGPARERLYTQIMRPDIWFAPAPACNVVFPEECASFNFSRQLLVETTRLEMTTSPVLIQGAQLNTVYFAPIIQGFSGLRAAGQSADKTVVYRHERFSGIVPRTEHLQDLSFYLKDASATTRDEVETYARRAALYHFLSSRYSSRGMSLTTRFLPRLVAGFPAVVLSRPKVVAEDRPTHFLGMITTLQHSLTQSGGFTNLSMSHARSHKSSKDDLDDLFLAYGGTIFGEDSDKGKPIEELIRPPWVSEEYSSDNISKLYQDFFGCSAIVSKASPTVEAAVDRLSKGVAGPDDGNRAAYIRNTTRRAYASKDQTLGSFHKEAVGSKTNFEGLLLRDVRDDSGQVVPQYTHPVENGQVSVSTIFESSAETDLGYLDVRKDRREIIRAYLSELKIDSGFGRGIRG
jgi:hypothetical protein